MVWFYQTSRGRRHATGSLSFQSHYGLILSLRELAVEGKLNETFNPTMVWFYPAENLYTITVNLTLSIPLWSDFINNVGQPA